jgi:hypothetical protein
MLAVDSFSPHTHRSCAALRAKPVHLALRYHYNLSSGEITLLHAYGIAVGLIAEFDTRTWHVIRDSPDSGTEHGNIAVRRAHDLGFPAGCVIWLTADSDIPNWDHSGRYFALAAPIIRRAGYRVGAYGPSGFIDHLIDNRLADYAWQCGAASWNRYTNSRHAILVQWAQYDTYGDVQVDNNNCSSLAGAWMPDGTAHAGQGDEFDMASTQELRDIVKEQIDEALAKAGILHMKGSIATTKEVRDLLFPIYRSLNLPAPNIDYNVDEPKS